ncbi:uncharacterized protein LOC143361431 [Halictus rubicundus]|uniref:uncharacterized protein LOC143361431 n=1 Tax=Halictus rubicundus TaxID=77578 RepID=UPI004035194C
MTVPRVQPIDSEQGRCSDWSALRRPSYLFENRTALPPCRFADQPSAQRVDDVMSIRKPANPQLVPEMALYDVSLPCAEPAVCIEELPSFCSQFKGCSTGPSAPRSCPVDVEDLALCFEPDKQQNNNSNCMPQRFNAGSNSYRRVKVKYPQYPSCLPDKGLGFDAVVQDCRGNEFEANWIDGGFCNGCPQSFGFCSEEQWLQCPASDRCPLFATTYSPYARDSLPPCVYEDFRNGFWQYGCSEDEQLLEDYL